MAATLIAHGGAGLDHGAEAALAAVAVAAMVIPLIVLVWVARVFLRAGKEDEERAPMRPSPPPTAAARAPRRRP